MILSSSGSSSGQVGGLGRAGWVRKGSAGSPGVCPRSQRYSWGCSWPLLGGPGAAPTTGALSGTCSVQVRSRCSVWGDRNCFSPRAETRGRCLQSKKSHQPVPTSLFGLSTASSRPERGICCATQDFLKQHIKFEIFFFLFSRRAGTKIKEIHILWKYTGNCHHRWGTIYPDPPPPNCKHQNIYVFKQKKNIWLFNLS